MPSNLTICERAIRERSDWRFVFTGEGRRTTCVAAPVWKAVYKDAPKSPNTVLIDHWDQDTPSDWTRYIEEWVRELPAEFAISRYVQHEDDPRRRHGVNGELRRVPYKEWLAATDQLETFVMTHRESYGYAILDMFARGTRVVCPAPFVPLHFRDRFFFETFETKDELIAILRRRPDPLKLMTNRLRLSDWSDAVSLIDKRFRGLLRKGRDPFVRARRLLGT